MGVSHVHVCLGMTLKESRPDSRGALGGKGVAAQGGDGGQDSAVSCPGRCPGFRWGFLGLP